LESSWSSEKEQMRSKLEATEEELRRKENALIAINSEGDARVS